MIEVSRLASPKHQTACAKPSERLETLTATIGEIAIAKQIERAHLLRARGMRARLAELGFL